MSKTQLWPDALTVRCSRWYGHTHTPKREKGGGEKREKERERDVGTRRESDCARSTSLNARKIIYHQLAIMTSLEPECYSGLAAYLAGSLGIDTCVDRVQHARVASR